MHNNNNNKNLSADALMAKTWMFEDSVRLPNPTPENVASFIACLVGAILCPATEFQRTSVLRELSTSQLKRKSAVAFMRRITYFRA